MEFAMYSKFSFSRKKMETVETRVFYINKAQLTSVLNIQYVCLLPSERAPPSICIDSSWAVLRVLSY